MREACWGGRGSTACGWVERLQRSTVDETEGATCQRLVTGTGRAVIGLRPAHSDEVEELIQDTIRPERGG